MKKIPFYLSLITVFFVLSCGKETDSLTEKKADNSQIKPKFTLEEVRADPGKYNFKEISAGDSQARISNELLTSRKINLTELTKQFYVFVNEGKAAMYIKRKGPIGVYARTFGPVTSKYAMASEECICSHVAAQESDNIDDTCEFYTDGGGVRLSVISEGVFVDLNGYSMGDGGGQFVAARSAEFTVKLEDDPTFYDAVNVIVEPWLFPKP